MTKLPQSTKWQMIVQRLQMALQQEEPERIWALLNAPDTLLPPMTRLWWSIETALFEGDLSAARQRLDDSGLPPDSRPFHELAYRIANRFHDFPKAMQHLDAIERLAKRCPLEHYLARCELLKQQGQYAVVTQVLNHLWAQLPADATSIWPRWQLRLWFIGMAHANGYFAESITQARALIDDYLNSPQAQRPVETSPPAHWTRRRQWQVVNDLKTLVTAQALPVCLSAGSLLAIMRDGDWLLCDKDIDLATLDTSAETIAQILVDSGLFQEMPTAHELLNYRQVRHRRSGLVVDLTHYQRIEHGWRSCWRRPNGEVLREALYPDFTAAPPTASSLCPLPMPSDPARYLQAVYGDWQRPDADFDTVIMAKNLTGLTPFLVSLAGIRIAHALFEQRHRKALALAQHLAHRGCHVVDFERLKHLP